MKIRYMTKGEAGISWQGERICIDKISFTMGDIRSVIHGLHAMAERRLSKDILMIEDDKTTVIPKVNLDRLFDNAAEMTEGWSFLRDTRNEWGINGERWLWDRMNREERIRRRFRKIDSGEVRHREEIVWNEKGVEDWFREVKRFKEELFVLVHLAGGAPARGIEIISIQHENGESSRAQRGIFIDRGFVQFVTSYHKGYSASQQVKVIHRYVPKEVGKLVVYYLWLVKPFVQMLQIMVRKQMEFSPFIWEPEPEEEWADKGEGIDGTDIAEDEEEEEDEEEDIVVDGKEENKEDVASRPQKQAKNIDGFWGIDRVRRAITRETYSRIGVKITTAIWRQVYPAI